MQNKDNIIKNLSTILFIIFFVFSINFYFGFNGLMPLDDLQHFHSGYRVYLGDFPFVDYYSITGPFLDIFQGMFNSIFGISWKTLILHTSFFNCIYSLSIFLFLKLNNFSKTESIIYSLSAATLMSPTAGNPMVSHHSFILSIAALIFFIVGSKQNKKYFIYLVPPLLLMSFFIKQVPTAYFMILIMVLYIFFSYEKKNFYFLKQITISILLSTILLILFLKLNGAKLVDIYDQYFLISLTLGKSRFYELEFVVYFDFLKKIIFLTLPIIPCFLLDKSNFKINSFIFLSLITISLVYEVHSNNQIMSFAILPLCIALTNIENKKSENKTIILILTVFITYCFYRILRFEFYYLYFYLSLIFFFIICKYRYKKYLNVNFFLICYLIISTAFYFERYIKHRNWDDLNKSRSIFFLGDEIDKKFSNLKWRTIYFENNLDEKEYILEMLNYFKNENNNYILISDYQIFNAILEKKEFSPVKYWQSGHSYPNKKHRSRNRFEEFFKKKIKDNNIKKIIIDNTAHFKTSELDEFLWLKKCLQKNLKYKFKYKNVDVFNIRDDCVN